MKSFNYTIIVFCLLVFAKSICGFGYVIPLSGAASSARNFSPTGLCCLNIGLNASSDNAGNSRSDIYVNETRYSRIKWHPGHYLFLYPNQPEPYYFNSVLRDLEGNPGFQGIQKQYFWNKLEPVFGVYDFSEIINDLGKLAVLNKRLVVFVTAESFITDDKYVPDYLLSSEYEGGVYKLGSGYRGYNVAYWNVNVQNRLIALLQEMGKQLDHYANLEAVNFQETSSGMRDEEWNKQHIAGYISGMLKVAIAAKKAFPTTVVLQYVNYPESSLSNIVSTLVEYSVGMGGPDVQAHNAWLGRGVYQYFPKISGVLPIGMAVDYSNYDSDISSIAPATRPSISSIYTFAKDSLKANYIFWLRRTKDPRSGSNYFQDVLDFFKTIDWSKDRRGGLNGSCPSAFAVCIED